jgi:hypothetical protein
MTNTVFPTFQTGYILDFLSAIYSIAEHWDLPNTEIFQSKDVASGVKMKLKLRYRNKKIITPTDKLKVLTVLKDSVTRFLHQGCYVN